MPKGQTVLRGRLKKGRFKGFHEIADARFGIYVAFQPKRKPRLKWTAILILHNRTDGKPGMPMILEYGMN